MEMYKKRIGFITIVIIAMFLIFICYSGYSIWSYGNKNYIVKSDAAIVLGAAAWDNEPSPVLRERINHSIWLYENGYVDKIIFTGGKGDGDKYAESEVSRSYAIKNNVDSNDIIIETKSRITEENLINANKISIKNNLTTFIIVSDPLHMKRAMLIAESIGMEAVSSPTPTSVYKTLRSKTPFFFRELFFYIGYLLRMLFRS